MRYRSLAPLVLVPAAALAACVPQPGAASGPEPSAPVPTSVEQRPGTTPVPSSSAAGTAEPNPGSSAATPSAEPTSAEPTSAAPTSPGTPAAAPDGSCAIDPQDMEPPGAGEVYGVPESWQFGEPRNLLASDGLTGDELNVWGSLDEEAGSDPGTVGFVQIRDLVLRVTYTDGTVEVVQDDPDPTGGAFFPDFTGDVRDDVAEEFGPDGVTVPVGGGRNYHFWTEDGPQSVDADRLRSVEAAFRARLAPGEPHHDPVLMSVGVDNWQDSIVGTGGPQPAIGNSANRFVTDEWSCITFTTDPAGGS